MRESDAPVHRYLAGGKEKVRPGTGREAGLGHARERCAGEAGRNACTTRT